MPLALFSSRILKSHPASRRSLRRAAGLGLGFLSLLSVSAAHASAAPAGTVNWDGTVADWFSSPVHWVGGSYPGAGDDAVNSSTAAMTLGQSTTINSFFSNGAFTLQGGTFTGNQANSASTITVNNVFTDDGGTINNFTLNQGTGGSLVFTGSGNNFVTNSIINSNIDMATNANAFAQLSGAVTENGTINLGTTSNGLQLDYGGTSLTLGSAGGLTGFGTVSQYQGTSLTNNGTVNANATGPNQSLNINTTAFTNTGTTEVQNGATLNVTSANTDSGNVLVKTGGTATFSQGLTQTAGLTQADGTLNSPLTLTGGTLAGTGTVVGAVTNTGGTVSAGNSASPFGTLAVVNGSFAQGAGGTLDAGFSSTQNSLLAVTGAVTTGGVLDVNYLGSGPYTGSGPFTFLDYQTLATSITGTGPTQYFSNETFLADGTGVIDGSNGFIYELLNNTASDGLQLEVLINGAPVPEASTTISLGVLLLLGGAGLWRVKRHTVHAAD